MLTYSMILAAALAAVFWSADRLLISAVALSHRYSIPPLITGIIIIGLGTSSPELAVSILAALNQESLIAVGNAFGSNIANLGLVVGTAALLKGMQISRDTLVRSFPMVTAATLLAGGLCANFSLSRTDATVMLLALGAILFVLIHLSTLTTAQNCETDGENMRQSATRIIHPGVWLAASLAVLLLGSEIAVRAAIMIAETMNIDKLIIGLTIIAIGTSLPELAAALVSVYRKQHSIAIGNILGSNIFNSLGVLGVTALIHPTSIPAEFIHRDFIAVIGITLLVWLLFALPRKHHLGSAAGLLLIAAFSAYLIWVYFSS